MNYLTHLSLCMLLTTQCSAQTLNVPPGNFIKITDKTNPKCVEYLIYKNELYCSQTASNKTPIDPKILSYEPHNIVFDDRAWKMAWGKNTQNAVTVEYVPQEEDIDNWQELVTSQFFPGIDLRPDQFGDNEVNNLRQSGISFTVNTIENKPDMLIFEFKVTKPSAMQQDEIQKIVKGKKGIYVMHYAIKNADMGEAQRRQWVEYIKKSSIKNE